MTKSHQPRLSPSSIFLMVVRTLLAGVMFVFGVPGCVMLLPIPMTPGPVYWPILVASCAGFLLVCVFCAERDD